MSTFEDKKVYDALALPSEALTASGVEILRAGLINDELYVTARRVFKHPSQWGDVLADIARRIALIYSAEDTDLTEKEILADIEEAFAADLGAPVIREGRKAKRAKPKAKARPAKRARPKKAARKSAKRKKKS